MIISLNHIGISVANLERSIAFYRDGLGMELVFEDVFEGAQYERILGLKGATGKVAVLKVGNIQIELFEFLHPPPKPNDPNRPVCDHGITHFCIEVTDIDGYYKRLNSVGATFHCAPLLFAGEGTATYGRDPDGNVFELLELRRAGENDGA
ncbi:MAG: VOC family protein [Steroidobacteraceae bacterium]